MMPVLSDADTCHAWAMVGFFGGLCLSWFAALFGTLVTVGHLRVSKLARNMSSGDMDHVATAEAEITNKPAMETEEDTFKVSYKFTAINSDGQVFRATVTDREIPSVVWHDLKEGQNVNVKYLIDAPETAMLEDAAIQQRSVCSGSCGQVCSLVLGSALCVCFLALGFCFAAGQIGCFLSSSSGSVYVALSFFFWISTLLVAAWKYRNSCISRGATLEELTSGSDYDDEDEDND